MNTAPLCPLNNLPASRCFRLFATCLSMSAAALIASPRLVSAQVIGGNVQGFQGGVQGNVQGQMQGQMQGNLQGNNQVGGIRIDAKGVVTPAFVTKRAVALSKKRMEAAARQVLPADLNSSSRMRMVSLVQLEAACEEYVRKMETVPADMLFLAGLQRIEYVFVYPDSKDIVIAGPAEGFAGNAADRVVGLSSGRPPLRLDDLIVALRALQRAGGMGCSIDPKPANQAALADFVRRNSSATSPSVIAARFKQMAKVLGMQDVRIDGIEAETHFAEVMVEADYRMKLVAVGLETPKVRGFKSYLSMAGSKGNSVQRWWFTPLYDAFNTNQDGNAFQLTGQRVQLMAQEEFVGPAGQRSDAPFTRVSTRKYAKLFTEKFPELAERMPIFAELQNLMDLAVLAALLKKERLPQKAGWKMQLFLDPQRAKTAKGNPPRQVRSVANYKRTNRGLITGQVTGGVTINAMKTLWATEFKIAPEARLDGIRKGAAEKERPALHRWWWD